MLKRLILAILPLTLLACEGKKPEPGPETKELTAPQGLKMVKATENTETRVSMEALCNTRNSTDHARVQLLQSDGWRPFAVAIEFQDAESLEPCEAFPLLSGATT